MRRVIEELYPLHRTLVSDDMDKALEIIRQYLPEKTNYTIETYPPKKKVWTWIVPERYVVREAYIETLDGKRIVDFKENPLHLVSYSLPIDTILSWEELKPHLYYSESRPHAIPWEFKYYERSWGFCLSKELFDKLPRDAQYHVKIDSEFLTDADKGLKVGVAVIYPEKENNLAGEILVSAHVCHPYQANDGLSGVAVAVELINRLIERPLPDKSMGIRFLFGPEQIGCICYLAHHEDLISIFKGGIFIEMAGNNQDILFQHSYQGNHLIDKVTKYVLEKSGVSYREAPFISEIRNDELVMNGPGVNIPTVSLQRWPYDEYHTSDDNPSIIDDIKMEEMANIIEEIIRIYASNYLPKPTFRGPVFLSGHGLWVDWRKNKKLNENIEQIMARFDGLHTVFDIANEIGIDYWDTRKIIEKFREKGLVEATPFI